MSPMKKPTETANVHSSADLQESWRNRPRKNTRQSDFLEKQKIYIYIKNQRGVSRNLCIVLLIKTSAFVLILSLRSLI